MKPRGLIMDEHALRNLSDINLNSVQKGPNPYAEDKT